MNDTISINKTGKQILVFLFFLFLIFFLIAVVNAATLTNSVFLSVKGYSRHDHQCFWPVYDLP